MLHDYDKTTDIFCPNHIMTERISQGNLIFLLQGFCHEKVFHTPMFIIQRAVLFPICTVSIKHTQITLSTHR